MEIDSVLFARWIVPVEPPDTVLENHAIAIGDGKIIDLISNAEARARYPGAKTFHLDRHCLIPGLINAHTHAAMNILRGYSDDLPLMDWLQQHIWPAEQKWVCSEFVRAGTRHAIAEMIRGGTTCFNDMYFFPDEAAAAASEVGMRASVGLIVIDFPTAWAKDPDEYFRRGEMVHDKFRNDDLIVTTFAPHAPYTVSDEPLRRLRTLAEELDIGIHMHVHEIAHEVDEAVRNTGRRPLKRLEQLGVLSTRLQAVHMTQLLPQEIETLGRFGVHVIHCPESNLKLASGFCPVHALAKAGVNVALGTDGSASNNDLDMFSEMRTGALLSKAVSNDCSATPAMQALAMATINGAKALGIEAKTGSLLPGKAADIVAVDMLNLESQPLYHPISQLVYATGRDKVTHVWIAGQCVLDERRLRTLDEHEVLYELGVWRDKLR